MSIINLIQNFKKRNRTLFTTPSHSQGAIIAKESKLLLGEKFFSCDYSEIDGFDNLSNPKGAIKKAQDNAAKIYGSKSTFFLTNGSTSGIVAAMLSLLSRNDKVLIARNCHKSVYNGLVLSGAIPLWLMPQYNDSWGIFESININNVEKILSKNKDIKMFIMTNPTYEGVISDVARISEICKKYNVILLVDEAHGALWNFYKELGTPALQQGADITVQSLHKTAGALNPSALLHINKNSNIDSMQIQNALNLITTTSPSYPLLLNIESTINFLNSNNGYNKIKELIANINSLKSNLKVMPNIEVYSSNNDITKLLIKITNLSGEEFSDELFEKFQIEDELANERSVLFLTGLGTTRRKFKKLEKALLKLGSDNIKITENNSDIKYLKNLEPRVRCVPYTLWNKKYKEVELKYSIARICMEVIADYPPGIPILLPGEVIRKEHIQYLEKKRKKIKVLI